MQNINTLSSYVLKSDHLLKGKALCYDLHT